MCPPLLTCLSMCRTGRWRWRGTTAARRLLTCGRRVTRVSAARPRALARALSADHSAAQVPSELHGAPLCSMEAQGDPARELHAQPEGQPDAVALRGAGEGVVARLPRRHARPKELAVHGEQNLHDYVEVGRKPTPAVAGRHLAPLPRGRAYRRPRRGRCPGTSTEQVGEKRGRTPEARPGAARARAGG